MAFVEVLHLAGRRGEAIEVVREALDRYEAKGNLTQAGMARARLDELAG